MSYSSDNSFDKVMSRMLGNENLKDVDKRVGSIAYDSIAPVALELAEVYMKMDVLESQTYLGSATGANLDKRVYDYGITRKPATQALRIAKFQKYKKDSNNEFVLDENGNKILIDMEINIGSRFAMPDNPSIIYEYIGKIENYEIVRCEKFGIDGNTHIGILLPLSPITDLITAEITSTYTYGEDEENDVDLRKRAIASLNYESFGGNIPDYIEKVNAIDGVGNTKVFPAWQYNGSVLLSIVDPQFNPITEAFKNQLKELLDPEESTGQGVGIAPIGHYITVTTPIRKDVDVSLNVEIENTYTFETIKEAIQVKIEEYFKDVRKMFAQNVNLTLYRARIIEKVLEVEGVMNVTDVSLNGEYSDIVYTDEGLIDYQYLPYLKEVVIE